MISIYWAYRATRQAVEEMEATNYLTLLSGDLATKDSVVAIAVVDDPDYDFISWKLGLEGVFFVRENNIDMTYKLDKSKTAFVLAGTLRHVWGLK